jgi:uncharacterized protein (TIGR00369 family)
MLFGGGAVHKYTEQIQEFELDQVEIAAQFISAIPHARALGLGLVEIGDGRAVMTMPYDEKLIGDPKTGVIHGGAVSAMMDTCCGAAVMCHPKAPGGTATIDLRIDYMRAATPGQTLVTTAECYHMTRNVAFCRATTVDDDTGRPVASATGAFTVEGKLA